MTNKEKYTILCNEQIIPLHAQPWWMDAVCVGKSWDVVLVEDSATAHVWAAMPYHVAQKWGIRCILMPVHSQYNSIYIAPDAPTDIAQRFVDALEQIIRKEHAVWCLLQGFYSSAIRQALLANGFRIRQRITYRQENVPPRELLLQRFSQNKRRQWRKAKGFDLVEMTPDVFYQFHKTCLLQRNIHIDYSELWAKTVLSETLHRQQGMIVAARSAEGNIAAAVFIAWDKTTCYYLLPTYDYTQKECGAMAWLTMEVMQIAHKKGLAFDFEGSMTPSIASSYQQFGGQAATYWQIEKFYNPIIRIMAWLRR